MVKIKTLIGQRPLEQLIVDRMHAIFLHALREQIKKVHLVRDLYFPGPGARLPLYGLQWKEYIYLGAGYSKRILISTLIHELIHFIFDTTSGKRGEKKTVRAERRLFKAFSKEQKEALWRFIPQKVTLENVDDEGIK